MRNLSKIPAALSLVHALSAPRLDATDRGLAPRAPILINFPDFPPYYFQNEAGAFRGVTTDTLTQCLHRIGRPFEFVMLPIERMQISMQEGSIDIHTYSYKAERESFVEFGKQELFRTAYRPFVLKGSPIRIQKIADFDRLKLGHILGLRYSTAFMDYVEKRLKAGTIDAASNTEQNLRKLIAGRIDAFVNAAEPTLFVAQRLGLQDRIQSLDWVPYDGHYFTAVSRNSKRIPDRSQFLQQMDQCIAQLKKDGIFCENYQRYGIPCPDLPNRS